MYLGKLRKIKNFYLVVSLLTGFGQSLIFEITHFVPHLFVFVIFSVVQLPYRCGLASFLTSVM